MKKLLKLHEKNTDLNPKNHIAMFNYANVLNKTFKFPESEAILIKIATSDKGLRIRALFQLGLMYDGLGLREKATSVFDEIIAGANAKDPRVLFAAGVALASMEKYDQAIKTLDEIPVYTMQYGQAIVRISLLYQRMGKVELAQSRLKKLIENPETRQLGRSALHNLNLRNNKNSELLETANKMIDSKDFTATQKLQWLNLKMLINLKKSEYQEAFKMSMQIESLFTKIEKVEPKAKSDLLTFQIMLHNLLNQEEKARALYHNTTKEIRLTFSPTVHYLYKKDLVAEDYYGVVHCYIIMF